MNKKYILFSLLILLGACSKEKIEEKEAKIYEHFYFKEKTAYNALDDKPLNGFIITNNFFNEKKYSKYKDGYLSFEKTVNTDNFIIKEKSYNSHGLLDGISSDYIENIKVTYNDNIPNGEAEYKDHKFSYIDGTFSGKNILNVTNKHTNFDIESKEELKDVNFVAGLPDFIKIDLPSQELPENLLLDEYYNTEKFTGGVMSGITINKIKDSSSNKFYIREFKDGALIRERTYTHSGGLGFYAYDNQIYGIKTKDILYYPKNEGIKQEITYSNFGTISKINSYNKIHEKEGIQYQANLYRSTFQLSEIKDGVIVNNEEYKYDGSKISLNEKGFYNFLGLYTSNDSNDNQLFINGIPTMYTKHLEIDLKDELKKATNNQEVLKEIDLPNGISNDFNGYVFFDEISTLAGFGEKKFVHNIKHYKDGELFETYYYQTFNNSPIIVSIKKIEDGKYLQKVYDNGILYNINSITDEGFIDGKAIYFSYNENNICLDISFYHNRTLAGTSLHYHGENLHMKTVYGETNIVQTIFEDDGITVKEVKTYDKDVQESVDY